ncbi:hypothetical protein IFR05_003778 [Cadophora sp. M221]|nr:hypothetical protein IFR05_003778 [Cadophora sp. M221]
MATDPTHSGALSSPLLTAWARKYGRFSVNDNKSGLTPTEYAFARLGDQWRPDGNIYEEHQKRKLMGFTSRELGQLDCLPTRDLVPSSLPNFILPMLRIENWETEPAQPDFLRDTLYPMANHQGMWVASNPVIWPILEPVLILATKLLTSFYVLPWFDALLNAPREPIPPNRIEPEDQDRDDLYSFRPRPPVQFSTPTATPVDRDMAFALLQNRFKYTFGFMKPGENPTDPSEDSNGAIGITITNDDYMRYDPRPGKLPRVFTWLEYSDFEHLLRNDLNSAERMCIEWAIAHEVMHAVHFLLTDFQGKYGMSEHYFDTEALPEIGYSYEQAINLGSTERFLGKDPLQTPPVAIPPLGFFLSRRYPNANHIDRMDINGVILKNPGVDMYDEVFPIPITFYEDVQQEEFWSVAVRSFGLGLLHYRSRKEGSRYMLTFNPKTRRVKNRRPRRFHDLDHTYPALNNQFAASVETLRMAVSLTPEERRAMEFGRDLLISSKTEESFWDNSAQQAAHVQATMELMESVSKVEFTAEKQCTSLLSLLQSMVEATSHHQVQIAAIQSLEAVNHVTYPDRRAALKAWNRGTRVFLNVLKSIDSRNIIDIIPLLLNLEVARMVLYDPTDLTLQTSEEFIEIQSVQLARVEFTDGNFVNCRNLCLGVLATSWCSIFARCGAAAILFALDKDVYEGWDARKQYLVMVNSMMNYCTVAAPATWKYIWGSLKTDLMDAVNDLQRPTTECFKKRSLRDRSGSVDFEECDGEITILWRTFFCRKCFGATLAARASENDLGNCVVHEQVEEFFLSVFDWEANVKWIEKAKKGSAFKNALLWFRLGPELGVQSAEKHVLDLNKTQGEGELAVVGPYVGPKERREARARAQADTEPMQIE